MATSTTSIEEELAKTAPRGTRDISIRKQESKAGCVLTFTSPYHDVPTSVEVDYVTVAKKNFPPEWWENLLRQVCDKDGFETARKLYLDYEDFKAPRNLLNCVAYWGYTTRPELFKNEAFSIGTLPDGNLKIGPYEINGPEARYAMTIPLETPITDHFQHTITHGDPEIMTNLWRNVK